CRCEVEGLTSEDLVVNEVQHFGIYSSVELSCKQMGNCSQLVEVSDSKNFLRPIPFHEMQCSVVQRFREWRTSEQGLHVNFVRCECVLEESGNLGMDACHLLDVRSRFCRHHPELGSAMRMQPHWERLWHFWLNGPRLKAALGTFRCHFPVHLDPAPATTW